MSPIMSPPPNFLMLCPHSHLTLCKIMPKFLKSVILVHPTIFLNAVSSFIISYIFSRNPPLLSYLCGCGQGLYEWHSSHLGIVEIFPSQPHPLTHFGTMLIHSLHCCQIYSFLPTSALILQ
jgi:hypothetical protein